MSNDVARTLGYSNYATMSEKRQFTLANGKLVEAIGQVESICSFGTESVASGTWKCVFYILLKAASPIIMGLEFLEQTKTMTEHRQRLVRVPRPAYQALSVCSVGVPRRLLDCELNSMKTLATPDSGSDIDLISPSFARERGLEVYPGEEIVELADGSMSVTTGFVRTKLSIPSVEMSSSVIALKNNVTVDFFLLHSLTHDLLVGEHSLEELRVFTDHQHALTCTPPNSRPLGLNRIRHLGAVDRIVSWIKEMVSGASSTLGNNGMV